MLNAFSVTRQDRHSVEGCVVPSWELHEILNDLFCCRLTRFVLEKGHNTSLLLLLLNTLVCYKAI